MSDLLSLQEVGRIGYLVGVRRDRVADPRYAVALRARTVDLLKYPCTCIGVSGECPTCRAWDAAFRANETRRHHAVRT